MMLGILGAGQLGRMLALAGYPLGLTFRFLDPAADSPAAELGDFLCADFTDRGALEALVRGVEAVTYEFENVPVESAAALAAPVYPPVAALRVGQDRLLEKTLFVELGLEVHPFATADSADELAAAVARIGLPAIVKTRRLGYDGKGQKVLRTAEDVAGTWEELGGRALLVERLIPFEAEVSVLGVRGRDGEVRVYPLVENVHRGGILHRSISPAPCGTPELVAKAERSVRAVMERLGYVGVLAIEFFVSQGRLLANEMAPRVHNSGHWTIEGAVTSQFENHLRAVCGLPLGECAVKGHCLMLNLVGHGPDVRAWLSRPGAHLHLYGKEPRAGRKVGHVTFVSERPWTEAALAELEGMIPAR